MTTTTTMMMMTDTAGTVRATVCGTTAPSTEITTSDSYAYVSFRVNSPRSDIRFQLNFTSSVEGLQSLCLPAYLSLGLRVCELAKPSLRGHSTRTTRNLRGHFCLRGQQSRPHKFDLRLVAIYAHVCTQRLSSVCTVCIGVPVCVVCVCMLTKLNKS